MSENTNQRDMPFTLKFQLDKNRAKARHCSSAQYHCYHTQLWRL